MQDKKHCAENLLKGALFGKWLSSSEDRTGQLDGEFQLERACHISGIDIGECHDVDSSDPQVTVTGWGDCHRVG